MIFVGFPFWNLIALVPPNDNDLIAGTIRHGNLTMSVDAIRLMLPSYRMPGRVTQCPGLGKLTGYARIQSRKTE